MDAFPTRTSAPVQGQPTRHRFDLFALTDCPRALNHAGPEKEVGLAATACPQCGYAMPDACRCPGTAGMLGVGASLLFLVGFWWGVALVLRWLWA